MRVTGVQHARLALHFHNHIGSLAIPLAYHHQLSHDFHVLGASHILIIAFNKLTQAATDTKKQVYRSRAACASSPSRTRAEARYPTLVQYRRSLASVYGLASRSMSRQARTTDLLRASDTLNVATTAVYSYALSDARLETFRFSIWVMKTWKSCEVFAPRPSAQTVLLCSDLSRARTHGFFYGCIVKTFNHAYMKYSKDIAFRHDYKASIGSPRSTGSIVILEAWGINTIIFTRSYIYCPL
jgi:hypothetical protein